MPYKNCETLLKTSFFHLQFITSRKKGKEVGSRLGHRADVINTKRSRILLYLLTNFAKIIIQSGFPVQKLNLSQSFTVFPVP